MEELAEQCKVAYDEIDDWYGKILSVSSSVYDLSRRPTDRVGFQTLDKIDDHLEAIMDLFGFEMERLELLRTNRLKFRSSDERPDIRPGGSKPQKIGGHTHCPTCGLQRYPPTPDGCKCSHIPD